MHICSGAYELPKGLVNKELHTIKIFKSLIHTVLHIDQLSTAMQIFYTIRNTRAVELRITFNMFFHWVFDIPLLNIT